MADKEDEWEEEKEKLLTKVSESVAKWSATFSLSSCCVCVCLRQRDWKTRFLDSLLKSLVFRPRSVCYI